jgi:hypothetical protein
MVPTTGEPKAALLRLKGTWITFRLRDICFPAPEQLMAGPSGRTRLQGLVLDVSEAAEDECFLEVELPEVGATVIVRKTDRSTGT